MWKHFIPSDTLDVDYIVVGNFADEKLSLPQQQEFVYVNLTQVCL